MSLRTLDDLELNGRGVLIRADLNVPMKSTQLLDDTRLRECAATIREVIARGGQPIVMSHLGRPHGGVVPELSLAPLAPMLSDVLDGESVVFAEDCIGAAARQAIDLAEGHVVLLENLRFHQGEEKNKDFFVTELAALGDVYINDAFSASHRAHASIAGIPTRLPAVAGRLLHREVDSLAALLTDPARPAMALIGGAKIADKLAVIEALCTRFEIVAIGGGVANTFLKAQGYEVGRSLYDDALIETAQRIQTEAAAQQCELLLPDDAIVVERLCADERPCVAGVDAIPRHAMIADLGPHSAGTIVDRLELVATLVWAGPLGAADAGFAVATDTVAKAVIKHTQAHKLASVVGGGETIAALRAVGAIDDMSYVSLAGGAFLEWLCVGNELPGLKPLALPQERTDD